MIKEPKKVRPDRIKQKTGLAVSPSIPFRIAYFFTYLSNVKIYPLLSCASARDKLIKVKAYIKTESGSAVIRLRMNGKVLEYTPDTDGRFEREFNFQNGGNYIMIDFDRFTGTVQMTAEYV